MKHQYLSRFGSLDTLISFWSRARLGLAFLLTCILIDTMSAQNCEPDNCRTDVYPLDGVSTFDLVLLNKHILGLEPLNSPYKIIAADANKSNSLTTFDIVELRKLILGNYTSLPNVESWRFIDKTFTFQNPINPFTSLPFPEGINCTTPPQNHLDFVAIKVGDVNNNAVTHSRPAERPVTTLHFGRQASRQSGVLTIPVTYSGDAPLEAIQIGLHFDPARLALIGPSQGDLPGYTADNFGLTRVAQGEVRTLWLPLSDEMGQLTTGRTLFYLSFRILTDLGESELPIQLDDRVLPNTAWKTDDTEYALSVSPASARDAAPSAETADLQASVRPNPTSGTVVFDLNSRQSSPGRIALFDAFGKLIFMRNLTLQAGQQTIDAPEVAALTAGVYMWKIFAGHQKCSGHLIKQ